MESAAAELALLEGSTLQLANVNSVLGDVVVRYLINVFGVGTVELLQIATINFEGESFMLEHRAVFHLVKLIELTLELNEVLTSVSIGVNHTFLELLKSVDDLEEVSLR